EPNRVCEGFQRVGQLLRVGLAERAVKDRRTTRRRIRHRGILTCFDSRRNIEARRYPTKEERPMANTFHVAVYVRGIPEAVERYRKVLGIEPAKVRSDYAKFELQDPPVIFSLNVGGEPGKLSHLGIRHPSTGDVASEMVRVKRNDVPLLQQEGTTCC